MLDAEWDARLRLYITATVQNYNHKMLAINNMPDHLHLFYWAESQTVYL
jgi:REP element-mobilizing transposase RayT